MRYLVRCGGLALTAAAEPLTAADAAASADATVITRDGVRSAA